MDYPFSNKSEIAEKLIALMKQLQVSKGGIVVKRLHSDGGTEVINHTVKSFLAGQGTQLTFTTSGTPEHNGIIERYHQTQLNITRSLLTQAGAPLVLWGEAIKHATSLYNCNHTVHNTNQTPHERYYGTPPVLDKFHVWGCDCYVWIPPAQRGKLDERMWIGMYIGVSEQQNAYRVLNASSGKVVVTRNVKFPENELQFTVCHQLRMCNKPVDAEDEVLVNNTIYDDSDDGVELVDSMEKLTINNGTNPTMQQSNKQDVDTIDLTDSRTDADSFSNDQTQLITNENINPGIIDTESKSLGDDGYNSNINDEGNDIIEDDHESKEEKEIVEEQQDHESITIPLSSISESNEDEHHSDVEILSSQGTINANNSVKKGSDVRRSGRTHKPVDHGPFQIYGRAYSVITTNAAGVDPINHREAMATPQKELWKAAEQSEINSLIKHGVFKVADRRTIPKDKIPLPTKMVYKTKYGSDGKPSRYKCRFVVKGFKQTFMVDYEDTFAPVVRYQSVKMLMAIGAHHNLEHLTMDVETAFLHGELPKHQVIYIEPPEGWTDDPNVVWLLIKTLYGLKQAPYEWHEVWDKHLQQQGWTPLITDPCVYRRKSSSGKVMLLYLYVDDCGVLFDSSDTADWEQCISQLRKTFTINVTDGSWILNMNVVRDRVNRTLTLSQQVYIDQLLVKFGLTNIKGANNPCIATDLTLLMPKHGTGTKCTSERKTLYQSMVGALLYAANTTRIDICCAVSMLTPHVSDPREHHITAAIHVFRYLSNTKHYALTLSHATHNNDSYADGGTQVPLNDHMLYAYADANWGGDLSDRKSTTGVIIKLYGNSVNWICKRQNTVARSSSESEYSAIASAVCEIRWCQQWINEVFNVNVIGIILSDSQSAIAMVARQGVHSRTKHIDIMIHFILDHIKREMQN